MLSPDKQSQANCPYCHAQLASMPVRKSKCPFCGKFIYVKTQPSDRTHVLTTEEDAKRIDDERSIRSLLQRYHISPEETKKAQKQAPTENLAKTKDLIWTILIMRARDLAINNKTSELSMAYFEQANFLREEGKPFFHVLQEAQRCQLKQYQSISVIKRVKILSSGESSCPKCKELNGKTFTLNEALETMPIPIPECSNSYGFCRCTYLCEID